MMRNLSTSLSFFYDYAFSSHCWSVSSNNRICLVKLDAIGDFFIMLSALKPFLQNGILKESQIKIVCDSQFVDLGKSILLESEFFGIDKKLFQSNHQYRMTVKDHLEMESFSKIVNLVFSRDKFSDLLIKWIPSKEKAGFRGDLAKQKRILDLIGQGFYSHLIETKTNSEFIHLYQLLAFVTKEPTLSKTKFQKLTSNQIVVFPGASWFGKAWPIENFAEIVKKLILETNFEIVICGGAQESKIAQLISSIHPTRIEDLTGKTSLIELVEIIRKAKFVLTNDTSAAHIAEYLDTKALAIVGGGHSARFLPYTKGENNCEAIMNKMDCFGCHWNCIYKHGGNAVPCISSISVKDVWSKVKARVDEN